MFTEIKETSGEINDKERKDLNVHSNLNQNLPNLNNIASECKKKHISCLKAPESLAMDLLSKVMKRFVYYLHLDEFSMCRIRYELPLCHLRKEQFIHGICFK